MSEHSWDFDGSSANAGSRSRRLVEAFLAKADVACDGRRPWDIQVKDERLFERILTDGTLGAGEAYVAGWWDAERVDQVVERIQRAHLAQHWPGRRLWHNLRARLFNLQTLTRARKVARQHYDFGNDLYQAMLDERMIYTCGYWRHAQTLDAAQLAKLDLVAAKLDLKPGMRVADIGCGWGGAARYFAERYEVQVVGCTISHEQAKLARENCQGVDVEIRAIDYRQLDGVFDRIYSLGMFEHVGYKNYRQYINVVRKLLRPDGLFLLHTIGTNESSVNTDPWIERYIFPNSMLPSIAQIGLAIEDVMVMEDWQNFGPDYDTTLICWRDNLERNWPLLSARYSDEVLRMFRYFLLSSAGSFRARVIHLWQVVLSPGGTRSTYHAPR